MELTVMIADDEVDVLLHDKVNAYLEVAIREFCVKSVEVRFISAQRRDEALAMLNSAEQIDVAFIDIMWPSFDSDETDSAKDLLVAALRRKSTVVVAFSRDAARLTEYLFDRSKAAYRPHAALSKRNVDQADVLMGTIDYAFSAAQKRLRSIDREFLFITSDEYSSRAFNAIGQTTISELACMLIPTLHSAKINLLTGGLSGASVVRLDAIKLEDSRQFTQQMIVKLARDREVLVAEYASHDEFIDYFPTNQFAGVRSEICSFGGWHALAFRKAPGATVHSNPSSVLKSRIWKQIFSLDLISCYIANKEVFSLAEAEWVTKKDGLLGGSRWPRLLTSARDLGASRKQIKLLEAGASAIFSTSQRQSALSVVHGDLHTRNVLVGEDGRFAWIDAASIRESGIWCEDLARFAVWLACDSCMPNLGAAKIEHSLRRALGLSPTVGNSSWEDSLWRRLTNTLQSFRSHWHDAGIDIDIDADWSFVRQAELLRAVYSFEMFDSEVRRAALNVALTG